MEFERKFVIFLNLIMLIIKISIAAYFIGTLRPYSADYFPNDFETYLMKINLIILIGLLGSIVGVILRSTFGKIVSIFSSLLIIVAYVFWYYEKFKWLKVTGLKEGTVEYSRWLSQIGWFREANGFDYIVLFSAVVLFIWVMFRYKPQKSNSLQ